MKVYIEIDMEATITHYSPGRPAKLYGPPENCYPAEDAEIEFSLSRNGLEVDQDMFSDSEMESIKEQVIEFYTSKMEAMAEDRR